MAAQPNSRPSAGQRERNAQLLSEVLAADERRLRRQAVKHAELPDDADDALQSAYALFLERYTGTGEPLAWLSTTVKHEAWAIRRRSSRRRERSLVRISAATGAEFDLSETIAADGPGPGARVIRDEFLAVRREAIANLKRDERRALWLLGLGFSYAEICEATGWTYTKVRPRPAALQEKQLVYALARGDWPRARFRSESVENTDVGR
jgi:DNA-directed RNA polymerase specialized sigma24 family protein